MSDRTVARLVKRGELRRVLVGRSVRFTEADVRDLIGRTPFIGSSDLPTFKDREPVVIGLAGKEGAGAAPPSQ